MPAIQAACWRATPADAHPDGEPIEVNVGAYVAAPDLLFSEREAMVAGGEHRLPELARRVIAKQQWARS